MSKEAYNELRALRSRLSEMYEEGDISKRVFVELDNEITNILGKFNG